MIFFTLSKSNKKARKHMGVVKLCWNEFFSKANNKNVIKRGGWVKLCWNDFLSKSNKQNNKTYGSYQIMLE